MLLALHILLDTLAPAENAPGVRVFMNAITGDPVLCILFGAVVTWAVHSSVASVLLVMSLAYAHFITPYAALALVLGANLGSAINPVFEGARRDNPASYRLPLGNLVNRLVGVALVAPFLRPIADLASRGSRISPRRPPCSTSPSTSRPRSSSSACSTAWRGC
jgi:phosphate:Na+ symporter